MKRHVLKSYMAPGPIVESSEADRTVKDGEGP